MSFVSYRALQLLSGRKHLGTSAACRNCSISVNTQLVGSTFLEILTLKVPSLGIGNVDHEKQGPVCGVVVRSSRMSICLRKLKMENVHRIYSRLFPAVISADLGSTCWREGSWSWASSFFVHQKSPSQTYLTRSAKTRFSCEMSNSLWLWQIQSYLENGAAGGKCCF